MSYEFKQGASGPQGPPGPKGDTGSPGRGVPAGGTTNQTLTKQSDLDYDFIWQTPEALVEAGQIIIPYNCAASATVGSWVRMSQTADNQVVVCNNNTSKAATVGVITEKISETIAKVMLIGHYNTGLGTLIKGLNVFQSIDGSLTSLATEVTTGYLQIVGVALSEDTILVRPQLQRIKRI